MSNLKHLLLTTNEEPNIAVIRCRDEDGEIFDKEQVELALSEHFDDEVTVNSIEHVHQHPLRYIVKYSIEVNDDIELASAFLDETWVY